MAFVNEKISEEDKARIDFSRARRPVSDTGVAPYKWTFDRDRDIGLIYLGGGVGEFPHFFVLYWKGEFTPVWLLSSFTGDYPTNDMEITWYLNAVGKVTNVSEDQLLDILKEALFVYGGGMPKWRDKIKAIYFKFDKKYNQVGE